MGLSPLAHLRGQHVDAAAAAVELHKAVYQGEEGIVAALPDALACVELGTHLADDDIAGTDFFPAKPFYAASLGVRIATVAAGTLTLLMCHGDYLTSRWGAEKPLFLQGIAR
jgi:hypothetical protein